MDCPAGSGPTAGLVIVTLTRTNDTAAPPGRKMFQVTRAGPGCRRGTDGACPRVPAPVLIEAMDSEDMDPEGTDAEAVRARYAGAAQAFMELAGQVPHQAGWRPPRGEWDLLSLPGHTSRALTTVETYLATP